MTTTHAPSEAAIQATMEELAAATRARDTTALMACFAEDAVLEGVGGTYRGKAAIARSFDWTWEMLPKLEYHDVGMGMRIVDSMAVYEGVMTAVNADGEVVRYVQLAHNRRVDGVTQAQVLVGLGREDALDRGLLQVQLTAVVTGHAAAVLV